MSSKIKTMTHPSASVNSDTASEDHPTSGPDSKQRRVAVQTERGSQQSPKAFGTIQDWRQNSAVLESICDHLPLKALKSARLVSKSWAIAGAVPLSHKSVVTRVSWGNRYGFSLKEIEEYLNVFQRNPVLETGFRLRHVHLDWGQTMNLSPAETDLLFKRWLALFSSEEFQLVTSLKIDGCPSELIAKFLLPDVLHKYWRNLKSLLIDDSFGHTVAYGIEPSPDSEKLSNMPELKLEELEINVDLNPRVGYDWEFLKNCSKLKKLKLLVTDDKDSVHEDVELERQRATYNRILTAFQGKELTSLHFLFIMETLENGERDLMALEIVSFMERLILINQQTLEDLRITADVLPSNVQSWFRNFPLAPQLHRLKRLNVTCESMHLDVNNPAGTLSPFTEALSVFRVKGYLKMENFCLKVKERDLLSNADLADPKISFVSEKSTRFAIKYKGEMNNLKIHLPQAFEDMMSECFPEINYVCMPIQISGPKTSVDTVVTGTAIFEKLGSSGVFNVPLGLTKWKSLEALKAPEHETHQEFWTRCLYCQDPRKLIYDPASITSRTLANFKMDWTYLDEDNHGIMLVFDTIPDLKEAWAKVKTSNCCWSAVKEDEVGPDDQVSAVCCRIFEDEQLR